MLHNQGPPSEYYLRYPTPSLLFESRVRTGDVGWHNTSYGKGGWGFRQTRDILFGRDLLYRDPSETYRSQLSSKLPVQPSLEALDRRKPSSAGAIAATHSRRLYWPLSLIVLFWVVYWTGRSFYMHYVGSSCHVSPCSHHVPNALNGRIRRRGCGLRILGSPSLYT